MSSVEARSYISFSSQTFLDFHPTLVRLSCLAVKVRARNSRTIQTLAKKTNLWKRHERRDWLLFIFRRLKLRFLWLKWSTIGHWNQWFGVQIPSVAELCSAFYFANPTAASKIVTRIWVPASLSFSNCQRIKWLRTYYLGTLFVAKHDRSAQTDV